MRQLKFRAWDKGAEQMYNWESIKYNFHEHLEHHKVNVMAFTGLHDKNGKDIYEGDILVETSEREPIFGCVIWEEENAHYSLDSEHESLMFWDLVFDDLEIIGNKFENPELLEES